MEEFFNRSILQYSDFTMNLGQLIMVIAILAGLYLLYRLVNTYMLSADLLKQGSTKEDQRRIQRNVVFILGLIALLVIDIVLKLDVVLYASGNVEIRLSTVLFAAIVVLLARFLDWIIGKVILHNVYIQRDKDRIKRATYPNTAKDEERNAGRVVQYIVYVFAILLILNSFQLDFTLFSYDKEDYTFALTISDIFRAVLIFMMARLIVWVVIQIVLYGYYKQKKINIGSQFAINQLLKYVIYFIALMLAFESLGIQMTLIWGGAAALLVGVGLGLQQTFNDFISGIILLFERSIEVGDVVNFGNEVGIVKKIGLRASLIETRGLITQIVPNSKLVVDSVRNWSHFYPIVRFSITVGVAYGSDTKLVKQLLLEAVAADNHVLDYPSPFVRFNDFGDSALVFDVYFFARELMTIEDIKSDLRFKIDDLFRENHIKIPFPQREIWNNPST